MIVGLPPTAFMLFFARPWSTFVPLMILGILLVALAVDSRESQAQAELLPAI